MLRESAGGYYACIVLLWPRGLYGRSAPKEGVGNAPEMPFCSLPLHVQESLERKGLDTYLSVLRCVLVCSALAIAVASAVPNDLAFKSLKLKKVSVNDRPLQ